jgi:flavin reductase (DIM6/NTAB) family NADH-FMN oxidoreductase RutF
MADFKRIAPADFDKNIFTLISGGMLITAEHNGKTNAMTASWGGFGHVWNKYAAYFFIRPQRHTKTLIDPQDKAALCVLSPSYAKALSYFGTVSGRDEDKIKKTGLTVQYENKTPYFAESETVFICKKLFSQPFAEESFCDTGIIDKCYPDRDFHTLYIAEIISVLVKN